MKKYFLLVLLLSLCFTQRGERWKNRFKNDFNKGNRNKLELQQINHHRLQTHLKRIDHFLG